MAEPEAPKEELEFPSILVGKKLLLGTESLGPVNGVSRTTGSLLEYLRRKGVNVAVAAAESPGQKTQKHEDGCNEIRLTGYPVPMSPELSVVYPLRLDRLFLRAFGGPPDLIYLASPASLGFQVMLQMRLLKLSRDIPVLCNFQTDLSGYCEILFPAPLDAWAVWVFRATQGYLFSHASVKTVFYPSLFVRRYIEGAGVPPAKLVNLRRGVKTDIFYPGMRDEAYHASLAPNGEIVLLSVARIAPEKGFEFLAQVAHVLVEKNLKFHLLIVGGNRNPAVEEAVQEMFSTKAMGSRVTFTGQLSGAALARAYASSDLFLHSSITETFGLVVLEAMASGLPVVARDEGGPSEIVIHNETGYLVHPADVDTFVGHVVELAGNKQLRERMSEAARIEAESATWEKINNKVAWHLADALTKSSAVEPGRTAMSEIAANLRITYAVTITTLIWGGLIITWVLVLLGQGLRTGAKRVPMIPWITSELRKWRAQRLRDRRGKAVGHGVRERRL